MNKLRFAGAFVIAATLAFAQTAGQDMKNAGQDTKQAAKDTGHATKKTVKKAGKKVKHGTHDAAQGVANKTESH